MPCGKRPAPRPPRAKPFNFERMEFMNAGLYSRTLGAVHDLRRPPRHERVPGSHSHECLSDVCDEVMTPVKITARPLRGGDLGREDPAGFTLGPAILKPGRRLGPYRLLVRLGQGGQGEVWKTRRIDPPEDLVALKVMKPEMSHNPARMAQFRREAQRGPRLTGPSLLAAHELAEIDGFHCMTMPFVECTALREIIKWRLGYRSGEETEYFHSFVNMDEPDYLREMARRWPRPRVRWLGPTSCASPTATSSRQTCCSTTVVPAVSFSAISAWDAISTSRLPSRCATGPELPFTWRPSAC